MIKQSKSKSPSRIWGIAFIALFLSVLATIRAQSALVDTSGNPVVDTTSLGDIDMGKGTFGDLKGSMILPVEPQTILDAIAEFTEAQTNELVTATSADRVKTNAFANLPPFDFSHVAGLYVAVSNVVYALGGSITNFPASIEQ